MSPSWALRSWALRIRPYLPAELRLRLEEHDVNAHFRPIVANAKTSSREEDIDFFEREWASEIWEIQKAREVHFQAKLFRRARRWLVPVPKLTDENSDDTGDPGVRLLHEQSRYQLLREIRTAQREWLHFAVPILGAIAGVIGAVTGLVAVLIR